MQTWISWPVIVAELDVFGRLVIAVLAGAVIGWEREWRDKPAGLRTHMMVALGAAGFVVATLRFVTTWEVVASPLSFNIDPLRTVAAVIGGVGFLGAGTIIEARGAVRGITTAASIWVAAAMGIASGLGLYTVTVFLVFLSLMILLAIGVIEGKLFAGKRRQEVGPLDDD